MLCGLSRNLTKQLSHGPGLNAIRMALERIDRANDIERELINALYVRYNKESIADNSERDLAYLARMRSLNEIYPDDPDIAALFADSYMSIGRWDYWDGDGRAKPPAISICIHIIIGCTGTSTDTTLIP